MKQNLWWAAGRNLISVPLAARGAGPDRVRDADSLGALLMSVSTIVVALNAPLLRRLDLRPESVVSLDVSTSTPSTTASVVA